MALKILIVGCGNMGGAMLAGWLAGGRAAADITVVDPYLAEAPEGVALLRELPAADARNTTRFANSSGRPSRPSGMLATDALRTSSIDLPLFCAFALSSSVMRSVSIRPGAITLTRIPCGASSRDSVLAMPHTPARSAFDSARFGIGCLIDEDAIVSTRP